MYASCDSKPTQFSPVQGNRKQRRQFSPNKFRYSPDENLPKNEPKVVNESNSCNSNFNRTPTLNSFNGTQCINNNLTINQQQTYFQPIIYPTGGFYSYMSALNYANYQPIPFQYLNNYNQVNTTFSNNFNQFYIPQPFCQQKTEIVKDKIRFEDDEDSFGSIFYPSSLIHPTQFKKHKYIEISTSFQQENSGSIEKPKIEFVEEKSKQVSEFEPAQKEKKNNLETQDENKNISNIQPIEKVVNEIVDSQKIFKPKTFKEIEEEEKKLNIRQYYQQQLVSRKIK